MKVSSVTVNDKHISKAESMLLDTIRKIDDPDKLAEISNEIRHPDLKISFLLLASDLLITEIDNSNKRRE